VSYLEDAAQAEELQTELRALRPDGQVILQEALPGPSHAWMPGPGGHYLTEFIVSLVLRDDHTVTSEGELIGSVSSLRPRPPTAESVASITRLRPPGSDWLFAKFYVPATLADDLLAGPVGDIGTQALANKWADTWFFIRYADPDPHLRLRFHGTPEALTGQLLPMLCNRAADLMTADTCFRFGFDTYEREIERFGGDAGMEVAETIFAADSRAVTDLLNLCLHHRLSIDRHLLAVLTVDDLLAGLGLDAPARLSWCQEQVSSWDEVSGEYRARKTLLRALLSRSAEIVAESGSPTVESILSQRRATLATVGVRLTTLATHNLLTQPLHTLYRSFVHLHCNRLLGTESSTERQVLGLLYRTRYGLAQAPFGPSESDRLPLW
jgi:thiopeptide-type bacteriocin biosynthesis protein